MIENGCSPVFPPWGRESNPSHTKHGMVIDAHPVASAPFKALTCFCLFGHRPKSEASRPKGRSFPERNISIPDSFSLNREAYRSGHPHSGCVTIGKTMHIGVFVIPGLTRNPLFFQSFTLLDAGSVIPVPDQVRDDGSGTGMTGTN
jgi:hypothetical protein